MVTLQKIDDSSVKFVFEDSDHYLFGDGEIVVPVNSLSLVIDDSEMVTFKKSATGDPFISFRADNSNLGTKAAIEAFYKENMVGGSGGVSEEEVQEMIDAATSGIPSSQVIEQLRTDVNTVSGQAQTNASDIEAINEKEEVIASALTEVRQRVDKKPDIVYVDFWGMFNDSFEMDDAKWNEMVEAYDDNAIFYAIPNDDYANTASPLTVEYTPDNQLWFNIPWGNGYTSLVLNRIEGRDGYEYTVSDANEYNITVDDQLNSGSTNPVANSAITQAINDAKAYYIDFGVLTTQGIHDADWDGIVAAINAHRPIYAGLPGANGLLYYTAECLYQDGSNTIRMTASDNSAHYFYTFIKNGSENYSFSSDTRPYTTQAEKTAWNAKVDTSAVTSSVTSASTDTEIPTAKATYDAIQAGGGMDEDTELLISSALVDLNDRKAGKSLLANYQKKGDYATNAKVDTKANVSDVMPLEKSTNNELVTASALNNLNNKFGGLSLVKITESEYAALTTKDENVLYVVVADPS